MKLRDLFLLITTSFWIGVAFYLGKDSGEGKPTARLDAQPGHISDGIRIPRKLGLLSISAAELARHNRPDDCWISIAGTVYDLTDYVDLHPSKQQEMDGYCGKDGTRAWDVKDSGKERGQAHSKRAAEFLEEYPQMGVLKN